MPDSMFLHDPTALAAVVAPHLFSWLEGPVVVCVGGGGGAEERERGGGGSGDGGSGGFGNPLRGMTVIDQGECVFPSLAFMRGEGKRVAGKK